MNQLGDDRIDFLHQVGRDLHVHHERAQTAETCAGEDFVQRLLCLKFGSGRRARRQAPSRIGPCPSQTPTRSSGLDGAVHASACTEADEDDGGVGFAAILADGGREVLRLLVRIIDFGTGDCETGAAEDL